MSTSHRPDWEAFLKEAEHLDTKRTKFREAYVWPYMNVEDLVKSKALLHFLNSRGKHAPSTFAYADIDAMRLGRITGAVPMVFLHGHTMPLDGDTAETYVRLLPWGETSMMKTIARLEHDTGEGLLILEIRQRILNFLVKCCHGVLHDMGPKDMITKAPILKEPSLISDTSDWPSVAAVAAEAPYHLPAEPNFDRLRVMVGAKRANVEDYIWALREDPGYFAEVVSDWGIHRQEQILDTNGHRHPILNKPVFWDGVLGNFIGHLYGMIVIWDVLSKQLGELVTLQAKFSDQIKPHERLPAELAKLILSFRLMLKQLSILLVSLL